MRLRLNTSTVDDVVAYIEREATDGNDLEVTIKKWTPKRSLEQNAALHGVIRSIANFTGNSVDEIKDYICDTYLGETSYEFKGETRTRSRRTSELSKAECADLLEHVTALAAELGIWGDDFVGGF